MPSQLLDSRRTHAAQLCTKPKRSAWLGAALLVVAACGSEAGSPGSDSDATQGAPTTGTAGAAATTQTTPSAAATKPADTKANTGTSSATPSQSTTPPSAAAGAMNASGSANAATPPASMSGAAPAAGAATPPAGAMGATPAMTGMVGMSDAKPAEPAVAGGKEMPELVGTPTWYWLDIASGTVMKAGADGMAKQIVGGLPAPDGVTVDPEGKQLFVLNMGTVIGGGNTGSLMSFDLEGKNMKTIMPAGSMADGETFNTGKQVSIDRANKKLYLGDREGTKVWRCDYDGGNLEVLVSGHGVNQIVGVAPDPTKRQFYFSDRNGLKLFRASMDMPAGETHANRKDVEMIYQEKALSAMPLDIELDLKNRKIYWTDRTQNKVFGMGMDMPAGMDGMSRTDVFTVASGLTQAIGLGFDHENNMLYVSAAGTVYKVEAKEGAMPARFGSSGSTGVHFTKIP